MFDTVARVKVESRQRRTEKVASRDCRFVGSGSVHKMCCMRVSSQPNDKPTIWDGGKPPSYGDQHGFLIGIARDSMLGLRPATESVSNCQVQIDPPLRPIAEKRWPRLFLAASCDGFPILRCATSTGARVKRWIMLRGWSSICESDLLLP